MIYLEIENEAKQEKETASTDSDGFSNLISFQPYHFHSDLNFGGEGSYPAMSPLFKGSESGVLQ